MSVSTLLVFVISLGRLGTADNSCEPSIYITVSSLYRLSDDVRGITDRELEFNWEIPCSSGNIQLWIGLFNTNPDILSFKEATSLAQAGLNPTDYPEGYYRTNISLGRPVFPGDWNKEENKLPSPGDHCYAYWIALYENENLRKTNCLKIRPTWMHDHKSQIGQLPLYSLFIPGTHNSGSLQKGTVVTRKDTFSRYLLTQDTDIWGQLVAGIRYLDVRVGYYLSTDHGSERFWVNHDVIRISPLLPLLQDLKKFLMASRGEVVILDFHRFPVGIQGRQSRHRRLITMLRKELGQFMIPSTSFNDSSTLQQIWAQNKRLIVAYGDEEVSKGSKWLWSPVKQMWGNQQTPKGLKIYLDHIMSIAKQKPPKKIWSTMAELTPTVIDIMLKASGGLREMADSTNQNITTWFQKTWWKEANIVATDFFLGNNIIDVAIESNVRKMKEV